MAASATPKTKLPFNSFSVIDLETTGFDPAKDEIIEYGAVRVRDGSIVHEFSQLADPGRPIPPGVSRLTGIQDADVKGKPRTREALEPFLAFLEGESVIVAHNAGFEAGFLKAKGAPDKASRLVDSLVLARIVWPELPHHDLQSLGQFLGIKAGDAHRATADAALTARLWLKLLEAVNEFHPAVVKTIARLLRSADSPYAAFFASFEALMTREAMVRKGGTYEALFEDFSEQLEAMKDRKELPELHEMKPLDAEETAKLFAPEGLYARRLPGFEHRPEQGKMARALCAALNDGEHALVEAGTGTGKSLAYLTPAISWSLLNNVPVVVSTNTRSLQDQLFQKDIPSVRQILDQPFHAVRLKGASNYLCVRRLLQTVEQTDRELLEPERLALAALVVWAARTPAGDISECAGFFNLGGQELWERLVLGGKECLSAACRHGRRCFLFKARGQAASAHLIVVNHALVFSEIGLENSILPPYSTLIFDEAHNLENTATENLLRRISSWRLAGILNRLHSKGEGERGMGVLDTLQFRLRRGPKNSSQAAREHLSNQAEKALKWVENARALQSSFFAGISGIYAPAGAGASPGPAGRRRGGDRPGVPDRLRYSSETQEGPEWASLVDQEKGLALGLGKLLDELNEIRTGLDSPEASSAAGVSALREELQWRGEELSEFISDLEFVVEGKDGNHVYWASREAGRQGMEYGMQAAPIDVGPLMLEHFFKPKQSVLLVSATLTVAGQFDFFKQRVGLDRLGNDRGVQELSIPSCFDYESQALLAVPSFLPEPDYHQRDFSGFLADLLVDVFGISRGRGLVLCTSYAMLEELHGLLKRGLAAQSILVLGQGMDGETSQIARIFKSDGSSVLLGTQSFWEGFDAPGLLCCVVVAKLPFPVFTDPVVQARCELLESRGINAFNGFLVPSAAIRLKQGFGRLIRKKSDFGAVIISDKRILTKRYGRVLLNSLPARYQEYARREDLLRDLRGFLEEMDERVSRNQTSPASA